jgi:hypothetical protein
VTPWAISPRHIRRTRLDLPSPGRPRTNRLGLAISFARRNHAIGSQHTVAAVTRCRPIGTPTIGEPDPAEYGHSPHTCTEVPRHSGGGSM